MSDDLYEDEQDRSDNPNMRQLREKAKKADEAERRAAELERRLAFAEAGIDMSDPKSRYFVAGYDGDLDRDAIRQAAERDGFLGGKTEDPPAPAPQASAEQAAIERISEAVEGAPAPEPTDEEAEHEAWARQAVNDQSLSLRDFTMQQAERLQKQGKIIRVDGAEFVPRG
jgi:hypothetical protein